MGKNTWLSIPKKPLPNRDNLILSTSLKIEDIMLENKENIKIFTNIDDLNVFCREKYEEIWIIGGYQIYKEFLERDLIKEMHVTYINKDFECDTFFPCFDEKDWTIESVNHKSKSEYNFNIFDKIYRLIIKENKGSQESQESVAN